MTRSGRVGAWSALGGALILALVAAGPAVAASPAGFSVSVEGRLGRCALTGLAGAVNLTFDLEHRARSGALRDTYQVTSDSDGRWTASCFAQPLLGGDTLAFSTVGSSAPFKTITVPRIRLTLDRVGDRITGRSPGDATPDIALDRCGPAGLGCVEVDTFDGLADPTTGAFAWDLGRDVRGAWRARMIVQVGFDRWHLDRLFPFVQVTLGSATVAGDGAPFLGPVSVGLRRGTKTGTMSTTADRGGFFSGTIRRAGTPMKVRTGDVISSGLAADVRFTIPVASIALEPGVVSGRCFPRQRVIVRGTSGDGFTIEQTSVIASTVGAWAVTLAFASGWSVDAYCATRRGDVLVLRAVAP